LEKSQTRSWDWGGGPEPCMGGEKNNSRAKIGGQRKKGKKNPENTGKNGRPLGKDCH